MGPGRKPEHWFSHDVAQLCLQMVEPNPHAGIVSPAEVVKNADKQLKREVDNYVYIKPIVPRLTKTVGTDKKHKVRNQWLWRKPVATT